MAVLRGCKKEPHGGKGGTACAILPVIPIPKPILAGAVRGVFVCGSVVTMVLLLV